jgi:hypothetical protein
MSQLTLEKDEVCVGGYSPMTCSCYWTSFALHHSLDYVIQFLELWEFFQETNTIAYFFYNLLLSFLHV